jgi:hypothetical protein
MNNFFSGAVLFYTEYTIGNETLKNKDRVTRTPLNPGVNSGAPEGWANRK